MENYSKKTEKNLQFVLKYKYLSSSEFQVAKKLKNFSHDDYRWQQDLQLWRRITYFSFGELLQSESDES